MTKKKNNKDAGVLPALSRLTGIILTGTITILLGAAVLPGIFGIRTYSIVTGSMEPVIPVGSMVYVQPVDADDIQAGDIIAFERNSTVVVHRAVENNKSEQILITKGDANAQEDLEETAYLQIIGKVVYHIPYYGLFAQSISHVPGKIAVILILSLGLYLI